MSFVDEGIWIQKKCCNPKVSEKRLKQVTHRILHQIGHSADKVSILLVASRRMRTLNRLHLKQDRPTDVLAFSQIEKTAKGKTAKVKKPPFLGDIVLCLPVIKVQAAQYGNSFDEELCYCLCHGILHLLGYEDRTQGGFEKMHRRQRNILNRIRTLTRKRR